ncbi:unnamed protein product [Camellia sinensis]
MESKQQSETAGKPIRCKAAICRKAGEALVIEEIQVDPPQAFEGPVAVFPRIFGHEAVGVVESVGENVEEGLQVSQEQFLFLFPITHLNGMPRDGTSRFRDSNGDVLHHFLFVSSFTEYTVVDIANIVKVNSLIPVDKACLLSCGVSTVVAEGARLRGASKIIGVDLNPENFEIGDKRNDRWGS